VHSYAPDGPSVSGKTLREGRRFTSGRPHHGVAHDRRPHHTGHTPRSSAHDDTIVLNLVGGQHLHFGPEPPTDGNPNWIKTVPGRNWFAALRLYGPTQEFFDRAWTPGDITKT